MIHQIPESEMPNQLLSASREIKRLNLIIADLISENDAMYDCMRREIKALRRKAEKYKIDAAHRERVFMTKLKS